MNDLVERLRAGTGGGKHWMDLHEEAADEIERLRGAPHLNIAGELESLSREGWAVSLIYDDAGNWAFGTDGFQNSRQDGDDLCISLIVKADDFKPSIQAAWNHLQSRIFNGENK